MYNLQKMLRNLAISERTSFIRDLDVNTLKMNGIYLGFALEYLNPNDQTELLHKFSDEQYRILLASSWHLNIMLIHLQDNPTMRIHLISKLDPNTFELLSGVDLASVLWKLNDLEKELLLYKFTPQQYLSILKRSDDIYFIASALESNPNLKKFMLNGLNSNYDSFKPSENPDDDFFILDAANSHIHDTETKGLIQTIEQIFCMLGLEIFTPKEIWGEVVCMSRIFEKTQRPVAEEIDDTISPERMEQIRQWRNRDSRLFGKAQPVIINDDPPQEHWRADVKYI